jgi:hypothetical protein
VLISKKLFTYEHMSEFDEFYPDVIFVCPL